MAKNFKKKRKSEIEAKQAMLRDSSRRDAAVKAASKYAASLSPIKKGKYQAPSVSAKGMLPPSASMDPKSYLSKDEWKKAVEYGLEGNLGISSKNSAEVNAGLLAMAALPIPAPLKGVVGKGARAVAAQTAKSAARRTAAESATIRKGTQVSRTAQKAVELEKKAAKESATKSVNTAKPSTVELRTPFSRKRELQERLDIGARMRAEGRKPGDDIPNADGSVNVTGNASKPTTAKTPKPTPREKNVAEFKRGLKEPTNPGKNASAAKKAKYQKDLKAYEDRVATMNRRTKLTDEGYLKADGGAPKGATAKSVARNQRKNAAEGPKRPSTGTTSPKKPAESKKAAEGPKGELVRVPSNRGQRTAGSTSSGTKPIALGSKPFSKSREVELRNTVRGEVVSRGPNTRVLPLNVPNAAKNLLNTGKVAKTAIGLAAAGAAGKAFSDRYNNKQTTASKPKGVAQGEPRGKVTEAAKGKPSLSAKAAAERRTKEGLLDRFGRKISREEFNKREAYRERIKNLSGAELAKAKKQEMARRDKYRKTEGKQRFGSQATKKTRRVGATGDSLDLRARRSLR